MCVVRVDFLRFGVTLKSRLIVLDDEVVVHVGRVAFLVVYRLQSNVLSEPNQSVHDPGSLSKLFATFPRAFAQAAFHVFSVNQVLVD